MDEKLTLITPLEGQKNWGNAINSNFKTIYNKYLATFSQLQKLNKRLEELDTIKISKTHFIYLNNDGIYLNEISDWDNPITGKFVDFANDTYINYDAWFIKTQNNEAIKFDVNTEDPQIIWNSGDLLILYKNNAQSYSIEQWTNIMGGYYEPVSNIVGETGQDNTIKTTYKKKPSFSGETEVTIDTPLIHWKPTNYSNGMFTYKAFEGNNATALKYLTEQQFDVSTTTIATVNKYAVDPPSSEINIIDVGAIEIDNIGCQIIFSDNAGNTLYFSYNLVKDGNNLKIIISRNGYPDRIYAKISIFHA